MTFVTRIGMLLLLMSSSVVSGQTEALPQVLILGDSVYRQPATQVEKELRGRVVVVFKTARLGDVWNSSSMLEHLDELLGDRQWDVIHFNCGLGDLIYRAPGIKSFRIMPADHGGVRATAPEQFEKNLRSILSRLHVTGAKVVWGSITPIRHSTTNVFELGSEIEYNQIAATVMKERNVTVNDMYTYVLNQLDMNRPAAHGADPFFFDRKPIHPPLVTSILNALGSDVAAP
ncbi:MAG: SGNH/GDSL hydrolase family protein [Planctomycetota bacterium]